MEDGDEMTTIQDRNGRMDGAYTRLFGDVKRGHLVSQVHAASISAGTELEKFLGRSIPRHNLNTLPNIFRSKIVNLAKEVVIKPSLPRAGEQVGIISDFGIFYHSKARFLVVELKDGDTFDTQKAPAIKENLQKITAYIGQGIHYQGDFYVCSFNTDSKADIVTGFKIAFAERQVMTGRELCHHLGIDYEEVLAFREVDHSQNRQYFDDMAESIRLGVDDITYFDKAEEYKTGQLKLFKGIK